MTPALKDRAEGRRPNRGRAFLAAATVGVAAGVLAYRALRSPKGTDEAE